MKKESVPVTEEEGCNDMTLHMGQLIRKLRKQKGLSQEVLGKGIISKSELSRVENGLREPDIFTLNALLHRLGKSLEYFEIIVPHTEYERLQELSDGTETVPRTEVESYPLHTIVISENDMLRDIRISRGLSQEQLCMNICARETISNIENGRTPNHRMLKDLLERMGGPLEKYYGFVMAAEFEVYEQVQEYQYLVEHDVTAAKELRCRISERIDREHPVNRQFLESSEVLEQIREGQLEPAEALAALDKYLRYTMPEFDGVIHRIPRRQEIVILEEMVKCYKKLQRMEDAKRLSANLRKKIKKNLKIS